ENARCTVQQLLLPVVDLVRMHPELTRQLGDRPVPSDRRQRHLRLEPRIMFLPCPLHVLLPRYPRVLGAGLHLSQLSHFRGPPQRARLTAAAPPGTVASNNITSASGSGLSTAASARSVHNLTTETSESRSRTAARL